MSKVQYSPRKSDFYLGLSLRLALLLSPLALLFITWFDTLPLLAHLMSSLVLAGVFLLLFGRETYEHFALASAPKSPAENQESPAPSLLQAAHPYNFAANLSLILVITTGLYWFFAYYLAFIAASTSLAAIQLDWALTTIYGGIALATLIWLRMPNHDISQAKSKIA